MTLMRWYPTLTTSRDALGIRDEMNKMLDGVFSPGLRSDDGFLPPVDIEETADAFVLRTDLPGVSRNDVKVSLIGDAVTIRGERKLEKEHKDGRRSRIERLSGSFERSFRLGRPVRADQTRATFKDGVLEVRIPKADEARVREIDVQVGS